YRRTVSYDALAGDHQRLVSPEPFGDFHAKAVIESGLHFEPLRHGIDDSIDKALARLGYENARRNRQRVISSFNCQLNAAVHAWAQLSGQIWNVYLGSHRAGLRVQRARIPGCAAFKDPARQSVNGYGDAIAPPNEPDLRLIHIDEDPHRIDPRDCYDWRHVGLRRCLLN